MNDRHWIGVCVLSASGTAHAATALNFGIKAPTAGTLSYAGGVAALIGSGIDADEPTGSILLMGTFASATVIDLGSGGFEFQIVGGSFSDTKHPELLAFYGLPEIGYVGGLKISFSTTAISGDAFTSQQIFSGNVTNQPVPIPAAVWLFGSGLLSLAGIARHRRRSPRQQE